MNPYFRKKKSFATELNSQCWIQAKTCIDDGEGGFLVSWHDVNLVFCKIRSLTAEQIAQYRTINVECNMTIDVRAETEITEQNRILFNCRIFEILSVQNIDEAGIIKSVVCKEKRE